MLNPFLRYTPEKFLEVSPLPIQDLGLKVISSNYDIFGLHLPVHPIFNFVASNNDTSLVPHSYSIAFHTFEMLRADLRRRKPLIVNFVSKPTEGWSEREDREGSG